MAKGSRRLVLGFLFVPLLCALLLRLNISSFHQWKQQLSHWSSISFESSYTDFQQTTAFTKLQLRTSVRESLSSRKEMENFKQSPQVQKKRPPSIMAGEKKEVKIFNTDDDLAEGIAKHTAELSHKFSHQRGAFTVVLSGGYLIDKLRKLVEPPYVSEVDWAKWHIFWVDERVVKKTDPDSNYKLAKDGFLSKVPIPEDQIYAINDTLDAEDAAVDYEIRLKELVKRKVVDISPQTNFPRFDLMLLGMGPDGHLASLFPHHPLLEEKKKWVTFIKNSPKPPPVRITFTFPVIDASAYIFMVVAGTGEVDAVKKALEDNSSTDLLPVQMVKLENGEFTWFLDKLAASKL